jgi:hypothetical protein
MRPNKPQQCFFVVVDTKQSPDWRDPATLQWHSFEAIASGKLKVAGWVADALKDPRVVTEATTIRTRLMTLAGAPNPQVLTPARPPPPPPSRASPDVSSRSASPVP